MTDTYTAAIARAADNVRAPSPAQLRQMQQAMWARHRLYDWQDRPVGALSAAMVQRGAAARVRRVEHVL